MDKITVPVALMPWVKERYIDWWRRYNGIQRQSGHPEQSFEEYMGDILKNALEKMSDL